MYLFFGDERKTTKQFSLLLFRINKSDATKIEIFIKNLRLNNNLPENYEFHYYRDSRVINKLFGEFVTKSLVETNLIDKIYYSQTEFISEPLSHIRSFQEIALEISEDLKGQKARFIFDKLGGEKTETQFKTEINRLCRIHNISTTKSAMFNNSKKSDFIQIADYLVALKDKGLVS